MTSGSFWTLHHDQQKAQDAKTSSYLSFRFLPFSEVSPSTQRSSFLFYREQPGDGAQAERNQVFRYSGRKRNAVPMVFCRKPVRFEKYQRKHRTY